ncbi:hypothetical protein EVAR_17930_1 [Eumeta japonica]|uniref:Uncharacterized protein n=1 Tax=Eumeta variegata TaxID=151549 RepID=A0A4C1UY71_EUMVA|nr:hypothetical protein EVAR_17930_1 [Eumeta japonica]
MFDPDDGVVVRGDRRAAAACSRTCPEPVKAVFLLFDDHIFEGVHGCTAPATGFDAHPAHLGARALPILIVTVVDGDERGRTSGVDLDADPPRPRPFAADPPVVTVFADLYHRITESSL